MKKIVIVLCLTLLFVNSISCSKKINTSSLPDGLEDVSYIEKYGIRHDSKDFDAEYKEIMEAVDKEVKNKIGDCSGDGYCHEYWHEKKRILKEKYGIEWYSPLELNPHVFFD